MFETRLDKKTDELREYTKKAPCRIELATYALRMLFHQLSQGSLPKTDLIILLYLAKKSTKKPLISHGSCMGNELLKIIKYIFDFSRGGLDVRLQAHIQTLLRDHKYT